MSSSAFLDIFFMIHILTRVFRASFQKVISEAHKMLAMNLLCCLPLICLCCRGVCQLYLCDGRGKSSFNPTECFLRWAGVDIDKDLRWGDNQRLPRWILYTISCTPASKKQRTAHKRGAHVRKKILEGSTVKGLGCPHPPWVQIVCFLSEWELWCDFNLHSLMKSNGEHFSCVYWSFMLHLLGTRCSLAHSLTHSLGILLWVFWVLYVF